MAVKGAPMESICTILALHQPDPAHLEAQIASLGAQVHPAHFVLFVEADQTSGAGALEMARAHGLQAEVLNTDTRLDAPRAFEAGLSAALARYPETDLFAFCDQDDVWMPDRLSTGYQRLKATGAELVHSDASLIDAQGAAIAPSLFAAENRTASDGLNDLLTRNTVTGMTMLMRRRLVTAALPFPPQDGVHFYHDLWLALVAAARGKIARVDRPLVKYRQHGGNAVGACLRVAHPSLRALAGAYALARYLALTLELRGLKHKDLRAFRSSAHLGLRFVPEAAKHILQRRLDLAAINLGFAAINAGRLMWALRATFAGLRPHNVRMHLATLDARLFALAPGPAPTPAPSKQEPVAPAAHTPAEPWWHHFDGRMTAKWAPKMTASGPVLNLLVPTLNPTEMFAGIATAVDLGLILANQGHPVRFIATDLPMAAPDASRAFVASRARNSATMTRISLACGVTSKSLPCHPDDRFLATAWWTAHVAHGLLKEGVFSERRFAYLIQDYEPNFYPWGTEHAGALASYEFPCLPIFNTVTLANHTGAQGHNLPIGAAFRPAIDTAHYAQLTRAPRDRKRIVLYGRPEVPRNLFPLAVEGLGQFLEAQLLTKSEVDVVSLGLAHRNVMLPGGIEMQSRGKLPWSEYPAYLAQSDLGLSLMMSPHPSHPPIEMAAAGMRVVTNRFGEKDLSTLAPHILSAQLTAPSIASALKAAWNLPEPCPANRAIDLAPLGSTLEAAAVTLATQLWPQTLRHVA